MSEAASNCRPDDTSSCVIDSDDQLLRSHAIEEGDDSGLPVDPTVGDESWNKPCVKCANITQCVPELFSWRLDSDFPSNRCQLIVSLMTSARLWRALR